jgi:hypothetical protein
MGQAWRDKQPICPITDRPIIIDPAALAGDGPVIFRCPVCNRQHQFHAFDASVVELENLKAKRQDKEYRNEAEDVQ